MAKDGNNIPVTGMTDKHPMNVKDSEYLLMLNGNIQTDISAAVNLTNEHSNFLCNNLPAGYVVIGSLYDTEDAITYLWLVKPVTNGHGGGLSQIGYLSEYKLTDAQDQFAPNPCITCGEFKQEATPLEKTTQTSLCNYTCISASTCLNFNINFPVRKAVLKKDNCGDTLYFTDFRNPVRALKLTPATATVPHSIDPTQRGVAVSGTCDTPPEYYPYCTSNDLNCESIKLFPTEKQPNVTPKSVGLGGVLRAGTYQLAVCYADKNGQRATRTFAVSNPVSVFDSAQTLNDQIAYPTNMSIKFLVENLDNSQYLFIDLFVIGTISGVSTVKEYDTVYIGSLVNGTFEWTLSDFEKGKDVTIDSVLQIFPVYELAQEITTANNVLLLANLTGPRDLNLQPAIVGLSPTIKWATAETSEVFYADGVNAANYRPYMRDEVYALGIVLERNNTLDTCVYPFVGRASTSGDTTPVTNADAWKYPSCADDSDYNLRWKVYNTATNQGLIQGLDADCVYNSSSGICATIVSQIGCASYTFKSTTIAIGPITGPGFAVNQTLTIGGGTGLIISVVHQYDTLAYVTLSTASLSGTFSGSSAVSGPSSASVIAINIGDIPPNDCYISSSTTTGTCDANYPISYNDASINCSGCTANIDPSGMCGPLVRPQTAANGTLCIDSQLSQYPSGVCIPYAYKIGMVQQEVEPLQTADYYIYNLSGITNAVPPPVNPTPLLIAPYNGSVPVTPYNNSTWIFPGNFVPVPINNLSNQALTVPPIVLNQQCIEYSTTPINTVGDGPRYFLGDNIPCPGAPCNTTCASGCTSGDYWGVGTTSNIGGKRNTTAYQSRWYSIRATVPTMVIKMKLAFSDGTAFATGDLRIDVYDHIPTGAIGDIPLFSTGDDTSGGGVSPATFYYTGADADTGVLIIGDVANSTGQSTTAGQLPLVQGQNYYIHCYLLPQGIAKLNAGAGVNCNPYWDPTGNSASLVWPCYLVRYAWANFCINYPSTAQTKSVTTPAVSQMNCDYSIVYKQIQVTDPACELQPYQYGDFAYWESQTKTYPSSTYINVSGGTSPLWGDVCGQPIRHFKFPDCLVSYLQDEDPINIGKNGASTHYVPNNGRTGRNGARIYPMGIRVNPEDVKTWLLWAGTQGLITDAERLSITGYKIVRGNRAANKSIIAKGLLFDCFQYKQRDWVSGQFSTIPYFYPNYPFNDLRPDPYLYQAGSGPIVPPRYDGVFGIGNSKYTFLSADTTFNAPALGQELKIEAYNFGDSLGQFYEVKNHPKYVLLGEGGLILAGVLAGIEALADFTVLLGQLYGSQLVGLTDSVAVGFFIGLVGAILELPVKTMQYTALWDQTIKNFGVPFNFARYYAAVGNYHSSGLTGAQPNNGNKRRIIQTSSYLLGGNLSLSSSGTLVKINNYEREDSVYVDLGVDPSAGFFYPGTALDPSIKGDFSKFVLSSSTDNNGPGCSFNSRGGTVSSMYASIKASMPDQYGSIHDIEWLYTGDYQEIDWNNTQVTPCIPIFGGDTFISRMSQKRKIPFFLDNTVGASTGIDSQYQKMSNITDATYFFNSAGETVWNSSAIQLSPVEQNLDCRLSGHGANDVYMQGYMYLFSYGIVSFIGESDYNLNYRYAKDTKTLDFYPHQSDIENWTQEALVPIYNPNSYFYNNGYSKQNTENFFCAQPAIYHNDACITTYRNRVITSIPDTDSDFYNDNWRIFLANDYHDFSLIEGPLTGLDGIEKEKVMVRFLNTTMIFNAFYTLDTTAGTIQVGTGSMFDQKPEEYIKSDLGYGGTDNHGFVSTPAGHFWADAGRHNILHIPPSFSNYKAPGADLTDIGMILPTFFRNNLPFYILQDFPDFPIDNNYKDIGITLNWDNKFDRLFLTKLDYQLLPKWKGKVTYQGNDAQGMAHFDLSGTQVYLTDTTYFCDKSWTAAYSPNAKTWISFYSFLPNYYIGHANYFQSGVNFARPGADIVGVWNHLISNKSYQVFYGKLYPFITDVVVQEQLYNKQLHSIEYQADFLRFQNDYDYFYNPGVTFNKMVIWSENQNSGNLVLVPQKPHDLSQGVRYPVVNVDSTTILVSRKTHNWRVNQFCDLVANKHNNVPPMTYGCSAYLKSVNPDAMWYNKPTFQRQHMTSDYFTLRLINDAESNYKIINKWLLNNTIKSKS